MLSFLCFVYASVSCLFSVLLSASLWCHPFFNTVKIWALSAACSQFSFLYPAILIFFYPVYPLSSVPLSLKPTPCPILHCPSSHFISGSQLEWNTNVHSIVRKLFTFCCNSLSFIYIVTMLIHFRSSTSFRITSSSWHFSNHFRTLAVQPFWRVMGVCFFLFCLIFNIDRLTVHKQSYLTNTSAVLWCYPTLSGKSSCLRLALSSLTS